MFLYTPTSFNTLSTDKSRTSLQKYVIHMSHTFTRSKVRTCAHLQYQECITILLPTPMYAHIYVQIYVHTCTHQNYKIMHVHVLYMSYTHPPTHPHTHASPTHIIHPSHTHTHLENSVYRHQTGDGWLGELHKSRKEREREREREGERGRELVGTRVTRINHF